MPKKIIGIDIGAAEVKAVILAGSRSDRATVLHAESFRFVEQGELPRRLASALPWLREFISSEPRASVIASLPSSQSVGRIIDLPPSGGATIDELIKFESEHSLPFPAGNAAVDYVILRSGSDSTTVLIGAAQRDLVQHVADWIRAAGGRTRQITIPLVARMALPALQQNGAIGSNQVLAAVEVDSQDAEILLSQNGTLRFGRAARLPHEGSGQVASLNGNALEAAVTETRRAIQAFRAVNRGATVTRVVLSGSGAAAENAPNAFESGLGAPAMRLDPWSGLLTSGTAGLVPQVERPSFAVATGLGLIGIGKGQSLNLIPEESRTGISPTMRKSIVRISAALLSALTIVAWIAYSPMSPVGTTASLEQRYAQVHRVLQSGGGSSAEMKERASKAALLRPMSDEIRRDSVLWLEVLRLLSETMPDSVRLNELSMEKGQSVAIRGTAKDNLHVAEALQAVRDMPMFVDARFSYLTSVLIDEEPRTEFEIIATLEPVVVAKGKRR